MLDREYRCNNCGATSEHDPKIYSQFRECPRCKSLDLERIPLSLETPLVAEPSGLAQMVGFKTHQEAAACAKLASFIGDKKYDTGKAPVGQMKRDFPRALLYTAGITGYGIEKYQAPGSWKEVEDAERRYDDAFGRHDLQRYIETHDVESKKLHLGHLAWNALALLEMYLEMEDKDEDD